MKTKARKSVPLSSFGVRRKIIKRPKSRPVLLALGTKVKPDAGKVFMRHTEVILNKEAVKNLTPVKNFTELSISKIKEQLASLTLAELNVLSQDERVGARKLAAEEKARREG